MIDYQSYRLLHFFGVFLVVFSLGALVLIVLLQIPRKNKWRFQLAITHGLGMLFSITGGFGMLARLGIVQGELPHWVYAKLAIWLLFGMMMSVAYRIPKFAKIYWLVIPTLSVLAGYIALTKPFS